ncbi:hypothetical protein EB077_10420 [bacterium]|nr:hypothetical protein [bacterium]
MSIDIRSFYYFLTTYDTVHNVAFKKHFQNKLHNIPKCICNSRALIKLLDIKTQYDLRVFQNSFMEYFRNYFKHT